MSADKYSGGADHPPGDTHHLLSVGNSVVLVLVLFVMTVSIFLVLALRGDVSALEEQARKSTKATKALQEELASLKELLSANQPQVAPASVRVEAPPPSHVDAAAPGRDCVIRAGSKNAVTTCIEFGTQVAR